MYFIIICFIFVFYHHLLRHDLLYHFSLYRLYIGAITTYTRTITTKNCIHFYTIQSFHSYRHFAECHPFASTISRSHLCFDQFHGQQRTFWSRPVHRLTR